MTAKEHVIDTFATSKFLQKNRSKIAMGAVGFGIAKSIVDGEEDDLLTSAGKGIKTGAVVGGLAYGAEHLMKTQTVQDLVKGEISDVGKEAIKKVSKGSKMLLSGNKLGTAMKMGMYAVGAATVLDAGQRVGENREAEKIKREQEYRLKQKMKKQKDKNKKNGYGNINQGEVVFDLFEARTGHHKMGNAKFN
ncbi:hypothetical protein [Bacillus cereus group sp. Bce040]|uniref:hypothetical protein n=1 Tax=Bacillus cereus group sp. Bce040 TaxID=3445229 RepID=UPI003F269C2F